MADIIKIGQQDAILPHNVCVIPSWRALRLLGVEGHMKTILTSIAAGSLLATFAIAQPRYTVHDFGAILGSVDGPYAIQEKWPDQWRGAVSSGADHAVLWYHSRASSPSGTIVKLDIDILRKAPFQIIRESL